MRPCSSSSSGRVVVVVVDWYPGGDRDGARPWHRRPPRGVDPSLGRQACSWIPRLHGHPSLPHWHPCAPACARAVSWSWCMHPIGRGCAPQLVFMRRDRWGALWRSLMCCSDLKMLYSDRMYSTVAALAVIGWSCPSGTWTATGSALLRAWHGYMAEMDVPTGRRSRSVIDRCSLQADRGGLTQSPGRRHLALTGGRAEWESGGRRRIGPPVYGQLSRPRLTAWHFA